MLMSDANSLSRVSVVLLLQLAVLQLIVPEVDRKFTEGLVATVNVVNLAMLPPELALVTALMVRVKLAGVLEETELTTCIV